MSPLPSPAPPLDRPAPSPLARHWRLDPQVTFLNHGSFGACPPQVLAVQRQWQDCLERQPVDLLVRELDGELLKVRQVLAQLLGADAEDLALVTNATEGVGCVLRSLPWQPDDEVLVIDHAYNACKNAAEVELARWGGRVRVAQVPFPLGDPQEAVEAILQQLNGHTKLVMIDHITSPTAIVLPIWQIVDAVQARGVDVLVDAAHSPGHVAVDLAELGAAYWTGNCHKWLCTPKGAAVLHVRRDRQDRVRPLTISHGANRQTAGQSRFRAEFDWTGTRDPSAWLAIPAAIEFVSSLWPGGLPELQRRNRELALQGQKILCDALGLTPPVPEALLGQMAAVVLPSDLPPSGGEGDSDALHLWLRRQWGVEVPVFTWRGQRILRISAQAYNSPEQYQWLAQILQQQAMSR